jgi:glycosyltransferase involved in cell wall biosynthesis
MAPRAAAARRLLHIIPRCVGGGPERSVLAIARATAELGVEHHHTLAVLDPPVTPVMLVQARRLGIALVIGPDPAELIDLVAAADVVQVHYWNHPALTACLRTNEFPPARVVVWCRVLGTFAPQVLTADVARFADRLFVTSPLSADSEGCRAALADGVPVDVVPGVTDPRRLEGFTPRPHEGCVVGYLGVVSDAKIHPRFADLCAAVDDPAVRFEVYGGGGGTDALRRRLSVLGIEDRVAEHGPTEDIRTALEGIDVFGYPLAPDTYATSEKALQEAMWVGIPPVVFGHGGPSTMVVGGESGLVVSCDDEYVRAIERLAADPQLRAHLGAGAQRHAREAFDPARHAVAVVALLDDLMARPRRGRPRLPGATDTPAAGFVRSLGDRAGPFAVSLAGGGGIALGAADDEIAASSPGLGHGEGGVVHHRNTYPDDPHLRLWSGLIAAGAGDRALAVSEFRAARALGLGDDRPVVYEERWAR